MLPWGLTFFHLVEEHNMIDRYSRECMRDIWSEKNKYTTWLAIEVKACEALCELGTVPKEALANIQKRLPLMSNASPKSRKLPATMLLPLRPLLLNTWAKIRATFTGD